MVSTLESLDRVVPAVIACCVLRQDTLLSQCLSPPRCMNECRWSIRKNDGGIPELDVFLIQKGVAKLLVALCYRNPDNIWYCEYACWFKLEFSKHLFNILLYCKKYNFIKYDALLLSCAYLRPNTIKQENSKHIKSWQNENKTKIARHCAWTLNQSQSKIQDANFCGYSCLLFSCIEVLI